MNPLLKEIWHSPLLWMLIFVPLVLATERIAPSAHTVLFVLAVLAIVPLAALLSHATESVAEKTGDASRYLDFYNRRRPHSSLDGSTPDQAYFNPLPLRLAA